MNNVNREVKVDPRKIKDLRKSMMLSRAMMVERSQHRFSEATIKRAEMGHRISTKVIHDLADFFRVPVEDILKIPAEDILKIPAVELASQQETDKVDLSVRRIINAGLYSEAVNYYLLAARNSLLRNDRHKSRAYIISASEVLDLVMDRDERQVFENELRQLQEQF
ncbi:MAG: hypothetical protein HRT88_14595 [Lentisphaeraceae bacterium]|nr:hypothetical protein [Lentisphaeraceae bacterium]